MKLVFFFYFELHVYSGYIDKISNSCALTEREIVHAIRDKLTVAVVVLWGLGSSVPGFICRSSKSEIRERTIKASTKNTWQN